MASVVGVLADTHGLIRPEILDALSGASLLIHAGDVGSPDVLEALGRIAPVTAVRGNNDRGAWGESLPRSQVVEVESVRIYVVHDLSELELDPSAEGLRVVVTGHAHKPSIDVRDGVLYLNPGSAGPRRFDYPVTVARLQVDGDAVDPEIVHLLPR
jgi:putative phosphoesterase